MSAGALAGRLALVTGGSSGIGAGCARALAAAGADLAILVHEDASEAREVVDEVLARGRHAVVVVGDVGDEDAVERAFGAVRRRLGVPDILVNSAGLNMDGTPVLEMSAARWERMLRTDLTGSFLTSRRFVRDLGDHGRPGAIVNITSIHAFVMRAGGADYAAAKGGQANLTRTMALKCASRRITVNAIAPGHVATPMNEDSEADVERAVPLGRAGTADEVGRLAAYLASPDASYITGATLVIDGGLSLVLGQNA